jgi:ribose-phosphate pyrophosphokinase
MTVKQKLYIKLNYNHQIPDHLQELQCKLKHFECGEFEFSIQEEIANNDIYIFQSFNVGKFNDDLLKLQIICDLLNRNNVAKIVYIAPFIPYTRQDKTYDTTSSLGSKVVASIINSCNISEITTYDLHASQIEGFFRCKVNHLSMIPAFLQDIKNNFDIKNVVIVFPDSGAASRFKRFFVDEIFEIAIINKNRTQDGMRMQILGDVKNKQAIIIDDMIDKGATIIQASELLLQNNAINVCVYATHGIFSADAIKTIECSKIKKVTVSDSLQSDYKLDKVLYSQINEVLNK